MSSSVRHRVSSTSTTLRSPCTYGSLLNGCNNDAAPNVDSMASKETLDSVGGTASAIPSETLAMLIQQSVQGNTEAFGRIYDLFLARVYRYSLYISGDRSGAEDMTEEIFVKAWQKLPTFRGDAAAFLTWLLRITHNHVVDRLRQQRKDSVLMSAYEPEVAAPLDEGTEMTAERHLLGQQALRLTRELPPQQRQVVILKFIEGLSNKEISDITGKREGAIRIAQMRALQALRMRLAGEAGQLE